MADTLARLAVGKAPVLWLQGQSCSGCSVSLLNCEAVGPCRLITRYISLRFHQTLSTATGHLAVETVQRTIQEGGYLLVVEGAVPAQMARACLFGDEPFTEQLARAARSAKAVVSVGSCASYGGIPAAEHNPTGACGAPQYLKQSGIGTPCVVVPGCPAHPDWVVGTLAHMLSFGIPALDDTGRPKVFFGRKVHDQCPRFADYEREKFAASFGDEGCLFKLGCIGTLTRADCSLRGWNGGVNFCMRAGAPCVGCASPHFAARAGFPLLVENSDRVES